MPHQPPPCVREGCSTPLPPGAAPVAAVVNTNGSVNTGYDDVDSNDEVGVVAPNDEAGPWQVGMAPQRQVAADAATLPEHRCAALCTICWLGAAPSSWPLMYICGKCGMWLLRLPRGWWQPMRLGGARAAGDGLAQRRRRIGAADRVSAGAHCLEPPTKVVVTAHVVDCLRIGAGWAPLRWSGHHLAISDPVSPFD